MEKSLRTYLAFLDIELRELIQNIDEEKLKEASDLIITAQKKRQRIHITGIGKPSHIAGYIAALFSSTGSPAYFLDATEAVHGSAGQIVSGDVVIAVSNSGQTEELKNTMLALKKIGVRTISITGNVNSWLAKNTDICLFAGVKEEGDCYNKPPRLSILAELIVLQSLSIILQERNELSLEDYHLWHPGGSLGKSLERKVI